VSSCCAASPTHSPARLAGRQADAEGLFITLLTLLLPPQPPPPPHGAHTPPPPPPSRIQRINFEHRLLPFLAPSFSFAQVSAVLLVAREASSELLLRGFLLTALSGWLVDRLYEADAGGLEGLVTLPGGFVGTVPDVALWCASLLATALFVPAAFLTAEETAGGVGGAMVLRTEAGSAMAAAAAAGGSKGQGAGSSSRSSLTQQQAGSSTEGPPAAAEAEAAEAGDGAADASVEEDLDPEILE
jgi:hypothetical protein